MKKCLKAILMLMIMIPITACNLKKDVDHLSQEELIKYVEKNITEEIQFIDSNTQDVDNYVYTFKLVDRDINFKVEDSIGNHGLNVDGSQFYDNYKRTIIFTDYIKCILEYLEPKRANILRKYNFEERYYSGPHVITVSDYTDLPNLAKYIVELDNLYQFNIKDIEKKGLANASFLADVISFSKTDCSIKGVLYSTDKKSRLKYDKVYNLLEEQYIKQLKQFNLKDETIPQNVWNKY